MTYPTPFTIGVSAYTEGADDAHGNPVVTYAAADKVALKPYRLNGGMVSVALRSDRDVVPYTGYLTL